MDKKRILIGLSIAVVLTALMCIVPSGNVVALLALMLVCGVATWEFYGLLSHAGIQPSKKWGTVSGLVLIIATWYHMLGSLSANHFLAILLLVILSTCTRVLFYKSFHTGLASGMSTLLGIMYVPLLFSFLVRLFLSGSPAQPAWAAFYVILCMKMSDAGGYFIGTRFGKNKLAPELSPKKSWEGLLGGILFCGVVNLLWVLFSGGQINPSIPLPLGHALLLSLFFPFIGTIGDLFESMIKRAVDVKDSNTMVYGLGGLLDMIDSILFAAPFLFIYSELFLK